MRNQTTERVLFFPTESSFASSAPVSESRAVGFLRQLNEEAELIFTTLETILHKQESLLEKNSLQHTVYRAKILYHESYPTFQNTNSSCNGNQVYEKMLENCEKLSQLLNHYQLYTQGKMKYEQFNDRYGISHQNNGTKKSFVEYVFLEAEQIKLNEEQTDNSLKAKRNFGSNKVNYPNAKEIRELKMQVQKLKKREKQLINAKGNLTTGSKENDEDKNTYIKQYKAEAVKDLQQQIALELKNEIRQMKKRNKILQHNAEKAFKLKEKQIENLKKLLDEQRIKNIHYQELSEKMEEKGYKMPKFIVQEIITDKIQGLKYYQALQKEYKIRFRRSWLKERQLLYSIKDLEVGIISTFNEPNQIKMLLHFTNCSPDEIITKLRLRVINSNENRIVNDLNTVQEIKEGEQVRSLMYFYGKTYPLGTSLLVCEFLQNGEEKKFQILLPTNILRMMKIKEREEDFSSSKKVCFLAEKKMIKEIPLFLEPARVKQHTYMCTFIHSHTSTRILIDIHLLNPNIQIQYQHKTGQEKITQYIINSIILLLKKENHL